MPIIYEFHLSIKDLEILGEFNLLQNLHLCAQKSDWATRNCESPLQLPSGTHLAKTEDKKDITKC